MSKWLDLRRQRQQQSRQVGQVAKLVAKAEPIPTQAAPPRNAWPKRGIPEETITEADRVKPKQALIENDRVNIHDSPMAFQRVTKNETLKALDLTWCPLYQRRSQGKPLGTVEAELLRILELPLIGAVKCPDRDGYAKELTNHALPEEAKDFRLKDIQIDSVYSYEKYGGGLFPLCVGGGKTATSLLCGHIALHKRGHQKVLLLVPPEVVDQLLKQDLAWARRRCALDGTSFYPVTGSADKRMGVASMANPGVYIMTYSTVSTATGFEVLKAINATCYILDEAHKVARPSSARTKRVFAVIRECEEQLRKDGKTGHVEMVALSGTITKKSISDYAHLARQCLLGNSPLPIHAAAIAEWSEVLDVGKYSTSTSQEHFQYLFDWARLAGAIITSTVENTKTQQEMLREAHAHRMTTCPGIVMSSEQSVGCSLIIHWREPILPTTDDGMTVRKLMQKVAEEDVTPDGDEIDWAMHKWKWLWELSTGFYNQLIWPTPEQEVDRQERRGKTISIFEAEQLIYQAVAHHKLLQVYHSILRKFLDSNHIPSCDSPALVAAEITRQLTAPGRAIRLPEDLVDAYREAREARFDDLPERLGRPVRICDYKIKAAVEWCKEKIEAKENGLIWHHHPEIGRWLSEYLRKESIPHTYAPAGVNDAPYKTGIVIASYAHGTGKNLQMHAQNLFLEVRREASIMEQTIGRTHRQGQKADEVHGDIFIANGFDLTMFSSILRDADYVQSSTTQIQKLCYATYDPIIPPVDPRLYVKLGLLKTLPSKVSVRVFDQVSDDKQVSDLFRSMAYKSKT